MYLTRGTVEGRQIVLENPVPSLEGKRVRVRLDLLDEARALSEADQAEAWREWVETGPQGPIEDNDAWP